MINGTKKLNLVQLMCRLLIFEFFPTITSVIQVKNVSRDGCELEKMQQTIIKEF